MPVTDVHNQSIYIPVKLCPRLLALGKVHLIDHHLRQCHLRRFISRNLVLRVSGQVDDFLALVLLRLLLCLALPEVDTAEYGYYDSES